MKKNQYQDLCNICDDILFSLDSSKARISIPWLHILRPHPYLLKEYKNLFDESGERGKVFFHIFKEIKNILIWWRLFLISLFCYKKAWFCSNSSLDNADFLFISHLISSEQAGKSDDFYFGNLPLNLTKQGYKVVIVLINHTKKSNPSHLASSWVDADVSRVILSDILSISDEIQSRKLLRLEAKKLFDLSKAGNDHLKGKILHRASLEAYSNGSYRSLRIYKQIQNLVLELRPSMVVATYEGHSWERMAFSAAHDVNPRLTCVGYSHSAIFQHQHSIKRCLGKPYDPDKVVTSGSITFNELAKSFDTQKISVSILGSCRNIEAVYKSSDRRQQACLVLPEGILSECNELFSFSVSCARKMPWINFIWRLHPLIDVEQIKKYNPDFRDLPPNIKFSDGKFSEDINQSRWAIYRGSTAIIQAAINGVQPIYLRLANEELGIDPLFQFHNEWKYSIAQVEEFIAITENEDKNSSKVTVHKQEMIKYCGQYNLPLDYEELPRIFLENKN